MIEMRLLEILAAFAQQGTQAAAADKLHITQPTLSAAMRRLEQEAGAPLFDRTKNRMTLNENGMAAAAYARRILQEEATMRQHIQMLERRRHTIAMAACTMSAMNCPAAKLPLAFPGKQITTSLCPRHEDLIGELLSGEQTFVVTDQPIMHDNVHCFHCYTEHMLVLVPRHEPEAARESLRLSELSAHQMVINSNGGAWDRLIRRKLPAASVLGQQSFEDWRRLIESSLPIWTFVSDTFMQSNFQPTGYSVIPVSDEDAHLDYWCSCLNENKKEADVLRSFLSQS